MKITLNEQEVKECVEFAALRREDSKTKRLKHSRNLSFLTEEQDNFSVIAEYATAQVLGVEPIFEFGRFKEPDLYYNGWPIDVKSSLGKPSFAVSPETINGMPPNTVFSYATGQYNAGGAIVDVIGVISARKCQRDIALNNFGYANRPEAHKVRLTDLTLIQEFQKYVSENE